MSGNPRIEASTAEGSLASKRGNQHACDICTEIFHPFLYEMLNPHDKSDLSILLNL